MVSTKIVSFVGAATSYLLGAALILTALASILFATQASQGHASHPERGVHSESMMSQKAEGPVPEAARLLYAQLSDIRAKTPDSRGNAQELTLHNSLGHVYQDYGNSAEAMRHYSFARDLAAQLGDTEQIVIMQTTLGGMYAATGRLQDARKELEAAFLLMDRDGPNAFATMRGLANVWRDSGKVDEALNLYGETMHLQDSRTHEKRVVPVEHAAGLLRDMGEAYYNKGQLDVAMSHYQQALDNVTSASTTLPTSGSAAMELAEIYSSIGQANHEKGDIQQAEEYYRKALRVQQRAVRENHPSIVDTLIHLARLQRDSGADLDSALGSLAKAEFLLKGRENHREFATFLTLQADILRRAQRLTEAEAAARRALSIQESLGSEDTPDVGIILNVLGSSLQDQQKYQDAIKQYMRALLINIKTVGSNRPETAATYNNLGNVYEDSGDDATAEKYYRKSLEIQTAIHTNDTPSAAAVYNNIATILTRQGRFAKAKEMFTKAVDIVRMAGLPHNSPERAVYEYNLEEVGKLSAGPSQAGRENSPVENRLIQHNGFVAIQAESAQMV